MNNKARAFQRRINASHAPASPAPPVGEGAPECITVKVPRWMPDAALTATVFTSSDYAGDQYILRAAHEREVKALREALRGLFALIESGDLVRNTSNDADFMAFAKQGIRITNACTAACTALSSAEGETK